MTLMSFGNGQVAWFKNVYLFDKRQMGSQMHHDSITSTLCLCYTIQLHTVSITSRMSSYTHNICVQGDEGRRWYLVSPNFKSAITSHHLHNHSLKTIRPHITYSGDKLIFKMAYLGAYACQEIWPSRPCLMSWTHSSAIPSLRRTE